MEPSNIHTCHQHVFHGSPYDSHSGAIATYFGSKTGGASSNASRLSPWSRCSVAKIIDLRADAIVVVFARPMHADFQNAIVVMIRQDDVRGCRRLDGVGSVGRRPSSFFKGCQASWWHAALV